MEKLTFVDEGSHASALVRVARAVAPSDVASTGRAEAQSLLEALEALVASLVSGHPSNTERTTAAEIALLRAQGARL